MMIRDVDATGVSGQGHVADGVVFDDGAVVVRWCTETKSTTFYASLADAERIHGHDGKTRFVMLDAKPEHLSGSVQAPPMQPFARGSLDAYQDRCEGIPFASIGGLDARTAMRAPEYVAESDRDEYLAGYSTCAAWMFGSGWRTCTFGFAPALEARAS